MIQNVITDAGRSASLTPKEKLDCTVRAYAIARGIPYDQAHKIMKLAGRKSRCRFKFKEFINTQPIAEWISFPAVKGQPRMKIAKFCELHPSGIYIISAAKHVYTVIDGVVHDDVKPQLLRCVYGAWLITRKE